MNDPFGGLLQDLLKVIGGAPGSQRAWLDAARSLAYGVATDGEPETNPDPIARIRFEELGRVAELHVADATGLPFDRACVPVPVGRGTWALRALDAWAPMLGRMVEAQRAAPAPPAPMEETGDVEALLGRFASTLGPVLLGMQFGSAAGHLAQRALGQYALPLPWPASSEVLVVPENVHRFAEAWSLPEDETRLWVCLRELTTHAVLSRPHVAARIRELSDALAVDVVAAHQGLAERLGGQVGDPEALQRILSDPEALLADLLTPGQRRTSEDLIAVTTAVGAYVDHVTRALAKTLVGAAAPLGEAWYRYRIEESASEQAAGVLFGLDLTRHQVDRGAAFVRGVVERSGEEALRQLWDDVRHLPTPAELDAPGLWLERIALPELPDS
ncbi:MAG: zinc-dependent metalloprotease [Actinomycetota bacterium]|jgi:putative hydrolase|nr:zinc-dependent metalloprotease [Actinomycetota bacterium]